jgi:hypothetical protein
MGSYRHVFRLVYSRRTSKHGVGVSETLEGFKPKLEICDGVIEFKESLSASHRVPDASCFRV